MATYPAPGRGAWRLTGGLLPGTPGSASCTGYYRLAAAGETPIGSAWVQRSDASHHAHVVNLGVKALQGLIGTQPDGWFGPATDVRVRACQQRWGLDVDGIVGRDTMRAALSPLIAEAASATGVPVRILGGLLVHESALDPAAVGSNGVDSGLAQINLDAHAGDVSLERAFDPAFAIHWAGEDLSMTYRTWRLRTKIDPWRIAVAHHNSPALAKRWATTGEPPVVAGRAFQIAEYVEKVLGAW